MKVSYDWLCDFLNFREIGIGPKELGDVLVKLGFSLDAIEEISNDIVFDLEISSNRPDCLSHLGISRELAVHFGMDLCMPDLTSPVGQKGLETFSVSVLEKELCPHYTARLIQNVSVKNSPEWLKKRLEKLGHKSINNIVDITNYVMLHIGQPLHGFDFEKVNGSSIVVRRAFSGERLKTIDGSEQELDEDMLLICDSENPIAIAGVIGGNETEVGCGTSVVLLESAYFDPFQVRRTSRKLGLNTEASYRFERGSDVELPLLGLNLAIRLIKQTDKDCQVSKSVLDSYSGDKKNGGITLTANRIRQVIGIEIADEKVKEILNSLGFTIKGNQGKWKVFSPSFRRDVRLEEDLVEEVLRHYGYDQIKSMIPSSRAVGSYQKHDKKERKIIEIMLAQGFSEAVTHSFTSVEKERDFGVEETRLVTVENPVSEEHNFLRTSLLPGLLQSIRRNSYRGNKRLKLFEIGKVFWLDKQHINEETRLGIIASGLNNPFHWSVPGNNEKFSFLHMKGLIRSLIKALNQNALLENTRIPFIEEGHGLSINIAGEKLGTMGILTSHLHQSLRLPNPVIIAEISLDILYCKDLLDPRFCDLAKYPFVESDVSFIIDREINFERILKTIQSLGIVELKGVELVDRFKGPELPSGKISYTLRLTFENLERTLTQEEANRFSQRVFSELVDILAIKAR